MSVDLWRKSLQNPFSYFCYTEESFIWHTICKKKREKKCLAFQSPIVKTTVGEENGKITILKKDIRRQPTAVVSFTLYCL